MKALDLLGCIVELNQTTVSKHSKEFSTQSTRSSADADNGLDAFSGQSRSTNMEYICIPHVTYSFLLRNSNFVFQTFHSFYDIRLQKIS